MNFLFVIPARGGSKGIPKKNIKLLNGKALILYALENALKLTTADNICVSTDDTEIINLLQKSGYIVPFKRPNHLATDNATTQDVLIHALDFYNSKSINYDAIVLLQPTSPFRLTEQIKEAIKLFDKQLDMVVSVKETSSNPYYNLFEENENGFLLSSKNGSYTRRQDCPKVWEYNGAIYVINVNSLKEMKISEFKKVKKYVMSEETSLDIDTPLDWIIAEHLLSQ